MDNLGIKPTIHLATLDVVERGEGINAELWANGEGRLYLRAYNECGHNYTDVELGPLMRALRGDYE